MIPSANLNRESSQTVQSRLAFFEAKSKTCSTSGSDLSQGSIKKDETDRNVKPLSSTGCNSNLYAEKEPGKVLFHSVTFYHCLRL